MGLFDQDKKTPAYIYLLRFVIFFVWVLAPMLLNDALTKRGVPMPENIRVTVFIIWYGVGLWLGNVYATLIEERKTWKHREEYYEKELEK